MAKIKINKLPKGFKLVNGKIEKEQVMNNGGYVTGDQMDYGLVTTPQEYYNNTNFNNTEDESIRYSLSSVPRDKANLEAEGGETVLTDLNSDGQFGLYDIKGSRHSSGGVPMFLPEQSFVFSDTNQMKFTKDEMAEFGIESKKKKTPAKISKRFELNKYYGAVNDQFADDIQARSGELMLKKNMMGLSKLAFGQEAKKKFEDGVPLAAHPYLVSMGEDPIAFTAEVEKISQQQAQMNAIAALPPEQQQQIMMLQQMMAQADQQGQPQQGQNPLQEAVQQENAADVPPMAMFGRELKKAQDGKETKKTLERIAREARNQVGTGSTQVYNDNIRGQRTALQEAEGKEAGYDYISGIYSEGNRPLSQNSVYNNQIVNGVYNPDIKADKSSGVYAYGSPEIRSEEAVEDFKYRWGDIIEQIDGFSFDNDANDPQWKKFQVLAEETRKKEHLEQFGSMDSYVPYYSKDGVSGSRFDGVEGLHTFNTPRLKQVSPEKVVEPEVPVETKKRDPIDTIIPDEYVPPRAQPWIQDQRNLNALGMIDDNLYLPWAPDAEYNKIDYVLDSYQADVNANAAADIAKNQTISATIGGPSAVAAMSMGNSMNKNAQAINRVNTNNVGTMNRVASMQPQMDRATDMENARRQMGVYDGTQKVLQENDNFLNWKIGEQAKLANTLTTNKANTYNMNTLYDNYAIDPTSGGMVGFTNSKALQKVGPQADVLGSYYDKVLDYKTQTGEKMPDALVKALYPGQIATRDMTNAQAEAMKKGMATGRTTAKKGKEINRMAVPFYTGKMGY
jgi:hypothetical protein